MIKPVSCAIALSLSLLVATAAAGPADVPVTQPWRAITVYASTPTDQLEPLPGAGPATLSPLSAGQVMEVLQYGKLRMFRGISNFNEASSNPFYKDLDVSLLSHAGHGNALTWNDRPPQLPEMITRARKVRMSIADAHTQGLVVLAYMDYHRWYLSTHGAEWAQQRQEWKHLLGETPEDSGTLLQRLFDPQHPEAPGPIWSWNAKAPDSVMMCLNAPTTLARAKACVAIDVANGVDGSYFDNVGMRDNLCSCDYCQAAFRTWLESKFTPVQRRELFGEADAAKVDRRQTLGHWSPGGTAWGDRPNVPALQLAHLRFNIDTTDWFRRELKAYGRSLNPNYVATSTCWSHDGRIIYWNAQFERFISRESDDFLFWEPECGGPAAGQTPEVSKQDLWVDPQDQDTAPTPVTVADRWGRRSFTPAYKYVYAMARGHPAVSKLAPRKGLEGEELTRATELTMAEAYANLVSARTGPGDFSLDGVRKMFHFQADHEDLFVGSKPYSDVMILASQNQALAGRRDATLSFIRFMLDLGLDCQAVLDDQISEDGLRGCNCLVLPATDMLSDAQMKAIEKFRDRGGKLVVFGPAGTRDEWDRDRPDGLASLVGELAKDQGGKTTRLSADGRVAFIPLGTCPSFPEFLWDRRKNDMNSAELRKAFEGTLGKAWPYRTEPVQTTEIHIAHLARPNGGIRLVVHVVNYDTAPTKPFVLDVRLPEKSGGFQGKVAQTVVALPENPTQRSDLESQLVTQDGQTYVRVSVPAVQVYGLVVIDAE